MDICLQSSSFTTISFGKLVAIHMGWTRDLCNFRYYYLTIPATRYSPVPDLIPFIFKARDWETIYSTKRRLNIDYWGSSKLEPVRTLPLWPPRTSTQFTLFSLSPIPKLLRAIPNSPPPRPSPQSYSRFWDARISSNLSTCSVHKQQQQRRNPGVKFDQPYKVHVPDVLPYTVHAQLLARFKVEVRYLVSILGYWLLCLLLVFV